MPLRAGPKSSDAALMREVIAENPLRQDEMFSLETLMDNVPDSIYFKDRDSRFTRVNRYAAERFGVASPALAVGRTDSDFFTEEHAAQALSDEQEIIRTGQPLVNVEEKETLANGDVRWVSTTKLPLRDRQGSIVGTFGISRDITERKRAEEQLQRRAFYDLLTDLPNRALFVDRLQHLFHRSRRSLGSPLFAVLYLDLDRFKAINDSLGHQAGDELLVATARRLECCLRPGDTLARLGGDEFTVLLDDVRCEADATRVAERIHEELAAPLEVRGYEVFTTVSVGIALSSAGYKCPEDMLRDADTAMYRAKANGRAGHQVFAGDMHQRAVTSLRLETDLRRALERREIVPYYQPVVDLDTGAVVGFEALARWRHPSGEMLLPDLFIPVAEETGLVGPIGQWMLAEACRQTREWQRKYPLWSTLGISVNVSGRQLSQSGIAADVERVLGATGLDPAFLTLEITESALMHNLSAATAAMQCLNTMSVGLHLDDFGTGYSSLAYLHSFPVQALKVDRSFVNRMDRAPQQSAIVNAIVSLAHNLGMEVIAEGIETAAQLEALRALRCKRGQGFLFSKPLPAEEVERLMASGSPTSYRRP
jgi:diguanylate cyclase (GGDEF)-like protein/PAS domain S-box-containing protein